MSVREKEGGDSHPQKGSFQKFDDARHQGESTKPPFAPEAYGLLLMKRLESIGVYRFKIPSGSTVWDMVDALNKNPRVEYAEPNYTMSITGK
jgi:hypothetical protein